MTTKTQTTSHEVNTSDRAGISSRWCFPAARRGQQNSVSSLGEDDDAFCRANNVQAGSPEYIACRKDRDVQRSNATARADRRQRDLGEYMLNHPDHP